MDIQPGSTRDTDADDYYHGPHLLCEITMSEDITIGDIIIPEGEHIGFIPFRKVSVDEQHIPRLLN